MKLNHTEYKQRNITIWNEVAPRYHKRWASVSQGPFASTSKLVQLLDIQKGDSVFDLACGTGVVTKKISQKIGKSGFVLGGDTSVTAIKIAKKWNKSQPNLDFVNVDAEHFNFSKQFDVYNMSVCLVLFSKCTKSVKKYEKKSQKRW